MALPTDELVQKAIVTTLASDLGTALIPTLWAARIERNLRKFAVLQESVVQNTDLLVPGAGSNVLVPLLPDLAQAVALTDGTDMSTIKLNGASSVQFTPSEYGQAVEMTRGALDQAKYDMIAEIMDRLAYSMALRIEGNIAANYAAVVPGTASKFANVYPNTKTTATITSTDILTDKQILTAVTQLEAVNNVPFEDNYWHLYISPGQWAQLMSDPDTRNDLRWSQPSLLREGGPRNLGTNAPGRGVLHNCLIIPTNFIPTSAEGAGAAVPTTKALLVAPRWQMIAWKRRPELVVDPTLYDFGRRRRFGITAGFDVEPLHYERAIVLTTAS